MPTISTALTVAAFAAFAVIGTILAIIDIRSHRLPNRLVALAGATGLLGLSAAAATGGHLDVLVRALLAAVVLLGAYLVLRMLSAGGVQQQGANDAQRQRPSDRGGDERLQGGRHESRLTGRRRDGRGRSGP